MKPHKHINRSIYIPERLYFITTIVHKRRKILHSPRMWFLLVKDLAITSILKNCEVTALAILPDHIHIIICIGSYSTSEIMHSFKLNSAKKINKIIKSQEKFRWQKSFTDHLIRSKDSCNQLLEYILQNPRHHRCSGFTWYAPHTTDSEYIGNLENIKMHFEYLLALQDRMKNAKNEDEYKIFKNNLESTDAQINNLVCDLYGLNGKNGITLQRRF